MMTVTPTLNGEPLVLMYDPPPPPKPPEEVHAAAMARGAKCKSCPLWDCKRGPVMATIRRNTPLLIIGEAPGTNEVVKGEGFVGISGQVVDGALAAGGVSRGEVSITNTILCMTPGGSFSEYIELLRAEHTKAMKRWVRQWAGAPSRGLNAAQAEAHARIAWQRQVRDARAQNRELPEGPPVLTLPQDACRARLDKDIEESNALVTLAVGKQALEQTTTILGLGTTKDHTIDDKPKVAGIKKQHGAPIVWSPADERWVNGRILASTYHPAFAMRDKCEYMPVIKENIARAARIARRGGVIDWREPNYLISPDEELINRVLHRFLATKAEVTVDIETNSKDPHVAQIRCVGVGATFGDEEVILVVPFNRMDGRPWWSNNGIKDRVALLLRRVLDECPLVFQNGSYDTTALLRVGLMTRREKEWTDTLLLHHDTPDNDLPHDLGFITRRYFEVPLWKENVDHKNVNVTNNDTDYHRYNARDVLATMRVVKPLRALVEEYNTDPQYTTDKKMAVKTRDMSELGLICNEWLRGKYSTILNRQCRELTKEFQEIVGKNINPRSAPQIRDLLYSDWGYHPVVATDGYEWEEEVDDIEDGSTSNQALTMLMDERIHDPKHILACEKLLEFRANDKIRGTNTDGLQTYEVRWEQHGFKDLQSVGWAEAVTGTVFDKDLDRDVENKVIIPKRRGLSLVRTTYKGHVVPTGRLASGDPVNFQNIPLAARGGLNLRDMYVAPPGHVLVGADYEQIEARLYAIIAQDQLLLDAIHKKLDIHSLNAASLLAQPGQNIMDVYKWLKAKPKDELKYLRTVAKRFCFGLIYGAGWQKIYQVMIADRNKATGKRTFPDLKEKDCQEWEGNWHRLHPETRWWHARCHAAFHEYGYTGVPMLDFRKRFFPGGVAQENAIPNLTIQGSAASIANRALLAISELCPYRGWSYWSGVVLQVHDYIAVCVPQSRAEEAAAIVEKCMYYKYEGMEFNAYPEITWGWGAQ